MWRGGSGGGGGEGVKIQVFLVLDHVGWEGGGGVFFPVFCSPTDANTPNHHHHAHPSTQAEGHPTTCCQGKNTSTPPNKLQVAPQLRPPKVISSLHPTTTQAEGWPAAWLSAVPSSLHHPTPTPLATVPMLKPWAKSPDCLVFMVLVHPSLASLPSEAADPSRVDPVFSGASSFSPPQLCSLWCLLCVSDVPAACYHRLCVCLR